MTVGGFGVPRGAGRRRIDEDAGPHLRRSTERDRTVSAM